MNKLPETYGIESYKSLTLELNKMKKRLEKKKIHYSNMFSFNEQGCEGWNEGIAYAIADIDRTLVRIEKRKPDNV